MTLPAHTRQRWVRQLPEILADPLALEALWPALGVMVAKAATTRGEFDQALAEVRVAALRQGFAEGRSAGAKEAEAAQAEAEAARGWAREAEDLAADLQGQLREAKKQLAAANRVGAQMRQALDEANLKLRLGKKAG